MGIKHLLLRTLFIYSVFTAGHSLQKVMAADGDRHEFYLTGSVGLSEIYEYDQEISDDSLRVELGLGLTITDWLSVELTRYDIEAVRTPSIIAYINRMTLPYYPPYNNQNTTEMDGYSLLAKFRYEINDTFSVYTKQGVSRSTVTTEYSYFHYLEAANYVMPPQDYKSSKNFVKYRASIGGELKLKNLESASLYLEWTRDDADIWVSESINLGMTYRF